MPLLPLPAVLMFDCDGLLVDTEHLWIHATANILADHHVHLPDQDVHSLVVGASMEALSARIAALIGTPSQAATIETELAHRHVDALMSFAPPAMPGALDFVSTAREVYRLAVVSNAPQCNVLAALTGAGFNLSLFDVIVTSDDVSVGKPDPESYLAACAAFSIKPGQAWALEDSPKGAQAARSAGMTVVGVPSDPRFVLDADVTLGSLGDPVLRSLLHL
jgi:HAD superfamily hydrolase (TIGR01509 family)